MKQQINPQLLEKIQDEIRAEVFQKYAEKQGMKTQENELNATLQALHEITEIPMVELKQIASAVAQRHIPDENLTPNTPITDSTPGENAYTYDIFEVESTVNRREFMPHLVAFVFINVMLIVLNAVTSSFPWAMFPLLGWGIGLVVDYMNKLYYPKKDKKHKIAALQQQTRAILHENATDFSTDADSIFPAVYRMLTIDASRKEIAEYLQLATTGFDEERSKAVALQLVGLRDRILMPAESASET